MISGQPASTTLALRYYAPHFTGATDLEIRGLLAEIERQHGVPYDVKEIPSRPGSDLTTRVADDTAERNCYELDFRPRAVLLRQRTSASIRQLLRSQSGRYYIAGTITITHHPSVPTWLRHLTPV